MKANQQYLLYKVCQQSSFFVYTWGYDLGGIINILEEPRDIKGSCIGLLGLMSWCESFSG